MASIASDSARQLFDHEGENLKEMENPANDVMDYRGLSVYLKMAQGTLRHKVMCGEIPHIKIGKSVRFDKKRIDEWLMERAREPRQKRTMDDGNNGGVLFPAIGNGVTE